MHHCTGVVERLDMTPEPTQRTPELAALQQGSKIVDTVPPQANVNVKAVKPAATSEFSLYKDIQRIIKEFPSYRKFGEIVESLMLSNPVWLRKLNRNIIYDELRYADDFINYYYRPYRLETYRKILLSYFEANSFDVDTLPPAFKYMGLGIVQRSSHKDKTWV